jgi:hypothetical protein
LERKHHTRAKSYFWNNITKSTPINSKPSRSIDKMGTRVTAEATWPVVGQKDPNPRAHGRKIKTDISAMMECARANGKPGKSRTYHQGKVNDLFKSMLEFIDKESAGPAGAMHPEAPTKGDLEALAAKLMEAVTVHAKTPPAASRTRSYVNALTSSPPQSFPQSAFTRMTPSSAAPISSRQAREIRVKTKGATTLAPTLSRGQSLLIPFNTS